MDDAKRLLHEEGWFLVTEEFADYRAFLERVRALNDSEYLVDYHFPDVLVFPHSSRSYWSRADHLRTKFLLQDKACLLPTYLLNPRKKSVVLDMCAAPGNKATHLACLMKNKGRLYAVELNAARYATLCQHTGEYGVIKTIHGDCLTIGDEQAPGVEYILLDPSCSGTGMHARRKVPEPIEPERLYRLSGLQYKLLSHAMNAFPQARRIVYATCSLYEQENESVVQGVLRHNGHFRLLDARKQLGMEWLHVGSPNYVDIGERCLYARPEVDLTIGMFVAVFERCPEGVVNEVYVAHEKQKESYMRMATAAALLRKESGAYVEEHDNLPVVGLESSADVRQQLEEPILEHQRHGEDGTTPEDTGELETNLGSSVKSRKKRKSKQVEEPLINSAVEPESSEIIPKKRKKSKSKQKHEAIEENGTEQTEELETHPESMVKYKKNRKSKQDVSEDSMHVGESVVNPVLEPVSSENIPEKRKKSKSKEKHETIEENGTKQTEQLETHSESMVKSKKKRKSKREVSEEIIQLDEPDLTPVLEPECSVDVPKKRKKSKSKEKHETIEANGTSQKDELETHLEPSAKSQKKRK